MRLQTTSHGWCDEDIASPFANRPKIRPRLRTSFVARWSGWSRRELPSILNFLNHANQYFLQPSAAPEKPSAPPFSIFQPENSAPLKRADPPHGKGFELTWSRMLPASYSFPPRWLR